MLVNGLTNRGCLKYGIEKYLGDCSWRQLEKASD